MTEIKNEVLTGERPLFGTKDTVVTDTVFGEGESPLKECSNIELNGCLFKWKYPIWYSDNITVRNCAWFDMARAGVWYSNNIKVFDSTVEAPKNFRRSENLLLRNVSLPNAAETLWMCRGVEIENAVAKGDYFAMNSSDIKVTGLTLYGNYPFDGVKNCEVRNCRLLSKDAFWNSENVTVYDSFISGEYLAWNAKNITFVNCTVESLQGLCYVNGLKMIGCKFLNTTLAFEYSAVDCEIFGGIDSIMNPSSGVIKADRIGELILDPEKVDPAATQVICGEISKRSKYAAF